MQKHKSRLTIGLIIAILVLGGAFSSANVGRAEVAGTVDELQSQKDQKRRVLLELKNKIRGLQVEINAQRQKIASLKNEIELYELQIEQTQRQIEALNAEIDVVNLEIIETLNGIRTAEENISEKKELLTNLIREIYRQDQISPLEIVLAHNSFSELLNEFENTVSFQNKNQELLDGLTALKSELDVKQNLFNEKKKELEDLKGQFLLTQENFETQKSQKQGLLSYTRGQESRYKQLLEQVSEEEAQVNREVFELDLAIRQKLGDKTLPPIVGAFSWPMEGILTQGYGNTGFTRLGYTFHNGIDIAAPANTQVYAAGDGVVYATGTGRAAYGNWVVVKHTVQTKDNGMRNLLTLYAHLNKISVSAGQGILQGDLVGLQGNTGNTTRLLYGPERGYHLHFSVFDEEGFGVKDGAYVDIYGAYQIPYGYTYDPMDFLK